jgi:hypothetical protein
MGTICSMAAGAGRTAAMAGTDPVGRGCPVMGRAGGAADVVAVGVSAVGLVAAVAFSDLVICV